MRRRLATFGPPALVLLVLLGAWEAYVEIRGVDPLLFPPPHAVAAALWNNAGLLSSNLATTAEEVGVGIAASLLIGFAMAVVVHFSPVLRRALYPLMVGSQAVPIVVVAPLLVFWWGFGIMPKLAIIVVVCFFPVVVTTVDALAAVDPDQLKLLRTLDASRWQAFRFAEAPAALPAALSGAKIAVAVAVIAAFIAESTAGSTSGLGHEILTDDPALQTARAYAAVLVLGALAVACFSVLALAERRLAPWATRSRGART